MIKILFLVLGAVYLTEAAPLDGVAGGQKPLLSVTDSAGIDQNPAAELETDLEGAESAHHYKFHRHHGRGYGGYGGGYGFHKFGGGGFGHHGGGFGGGHGFGGGGGFGGFGGGFFIGGGFVAGGGGFIGKRR